MKDTYYAIELEDYSIPPFCSGFTRTYAGTKAHLSDFMETLSKHRSKDSFQPLLIGTTKKSRLTGRGVAPSGDS